MNSLAQKVLDGNTRAIARAISIVENDLPEKETIIDDLHLHSGHALVWGLTGPPGSGKSSLLNLILKIERKRGRKIAVIAIDPSSPFSGGAILGDRLRMQKHAIDGGIFRSIDTHYSDGIGEDNPVSQRVVHRHPAGIEEAV